MRVEPRDYAVYDDNNIRGFFDIGENRYRWLSNFFPCPVQYEGIVYGSSENSYQAAKVRHGYRDSLIACSPASSKFLWKGLPLIDKTSEEWNNRRYEVMVEVVFSKFLINKDLRQKLLETGDKHLEERNSWHDSEWGVDYKTGKGKNMLGEILMNIRRFWKNAKTPSIRTSINLC